MSVSKTHPWFFMKACAGSELGCGVMVATQLSTNTLRGGCMSWMTDACMLTVSLRVNLLEVLSDFQSSKKQNNSVDISIQKKKKKKKKKTFSSHHLWCSSPVMSCRENCGCLSAAAVSLWAIHAGYGRLLCTLCFLRMKMSRVGTAASAQMVRPAHPILESHTGKTNNCIWIVFLHDSPLSQTIFSPNFQRKHSLPLKTTCEGLIVFLFNWEFISRLHF